MIVSDIVIIFIETTTLELLCKHQTNVFSNYKNVINTYFMCSSSITLNNFVPRLWRRLVYEEQQVLHDCGD